MSQSVIDHTHTCSQ